MTKGVWRRLLAGTAFVALGVAFAAVALEPTPARARSNPAELLDPQIMSGTRCAGGGGTAMRAFAAIGMARLGLGGKREAKADVPLWPGLGTISYPISTRNKLAQQYFDQGLRLAYAFNHPEAIRSFQQAQAFDPKCAMCAWGEAYALGPNINLDMQADAVAPAWTALKKAQSLTKYANPKEQALIAALAKRYQETPPADRGDLNKAYAAAMAGVAKTYPDDLDIQVLYAESMMDTRPWDYWKPGGTEPHPEVAALVPTLERVIKAAPNHAGALHLYIHAVELPDPKRAEAAADRLGPQMPGAGHLVHMPGHIYMRIGRHADSMKANLVAVDEDEKFIKARGGNAGFYGMAYYPHNVHFVLVEASFGGDTETAIKMAKKLDPLVPTGILKAAFFAQPVKMAPMLTLAHFGDEAAVMAMAKPPEDLPYLVDMWHYARAIVLVKKGDIKGADAELTEMKKVSASNSLAQYPQGLLPSVALGTMAEEIVSGRIAQAQKKPKVAITHFRRAVELQAALPYTEPPFWYYQTKQSLGGLLLASGKAKEAGDIFRASLLDQPGNAWALYGLMKSYEAAGDQAAAAETKKYFEKAWFGKARDIDLTSM